MVFKRLISNAKFDMSDEEKGWAITERELELRRTAAVERDGLEIRAFTLINPGNPTGQVLSRKELEIICKFCAKYDIVLLADEVYQVNPASAFFDAALCLSPPTVFFPRFHPSPEKYIRRRKRILLGEERCEDKPSWRRPNI